MDLIIYIIIYLLLSPFFAVFTDFKSGKIKNYFIFPLLFISLFLTFFILNFYSNIDNIIGLVVVTVFGYLFYINNKWGAGDGKYIMLIGLNSIIISHLLGFNINIINLLFTFIFGILFIYTLFFILINIKKVFKIKFKYNFNIKLLDGLYIVSFIYIISYFLSSYIGGNYLYIIIFLSITLLIPHLLSIKNTYIKTIIIGSGFLVGILKLDYISISLIGIIFFIFTILQSYTEQIFNIIDVKKIHLYNIIQGTILTKTSISEIKKDTGIEFQESPLQGNEVFKLIGIYKEIGKNPELIIYKELRIGVIIYIGFLLSVFINLLQ